MKLIIIVLSLTLIGCSPSTDRASTTSETIRTKCFNGVKYYVYKEYRLVENRGYGYMSVVYDKDTKEIVLCN